MSNLVTNYEDLGEISSFLDGKVAELNTLYGDLETLYNEISKNWSGKDADTYTSKAHDILNKNKATTKNIEVLKDALKYASEKYSNSEEVFKNTAKGDVVNG